MTAKIKKSRHSGESRNPVPLSSIPLAAESRGEGAASAPLAVREGPITPYLAKPQQLCHSRESGNPAAFHAAGWSATTLGEICDKPEYGWTTKATQESGSIHLLRTSDITSGAIDWRTVPYCTQAPVDVERYLVRDGDILISRAGSVGVSNLVASPEKAVFASYLIRFRPKAEINPKYIAYFLKSPAYWTQISEKQSGIALLNVNAKKLAQIQLPLPRRDVQDRIVAELETQLTRLDASVTALKRVQANLKRYRASVLKDACEGRLVPTEAELARREGRHYESGAQLLARIVDQRHTGGEKNKVVTGEPPRGTNAGVTQWLDMVVAWPVL